MQTISESISRHNASEPSKSQLQRLKCAHNSRVPQHPHSCSYSPLTPDGLPQPQPSAPLVIIFFSAILRTSDKYSECRETYRV